MRSVFVLCFVAFVALKASVIPAAAQAADYLVTFQPGTTQADRAAVAGRHGAALRYNYRIINSIAITVPNENVRRALEQDPSVLRVTPDYPVFASQSQSFDHANPNGKPGGGGTTTPAPQVVPLGVQRVLGSSNAPANDAGSGIRVAIVDTGVDYNHADLKRPDGTSIVVGSHNSVDETKPCLDDNGHGTHVAGTVAAQNNSQDVVGVAPGVSLLCVKVLNAQGSGAWSTIIDGLDWVWNNDAPLAHVVNMSLGGGGTNEDSDLRQAIGRLHAAGVIVVVAAGNDPALDVSQQAPAAYTELVLTVASTTAADGSSACGITVTKDTASSFTSDGVGVTISAPGQDKDNITQRGAFCYLNPVGILSLKRGGGTTRMSGTSMATPHVSGIVARLVKADPANYTFAGLKGYFDSSTGAEFFGSAPYDSLAKSYTFDGDREGIAILK